MRYLCTILILLALAAPAFGQATGNKWIHYETDPCDSILLVLKDSSGVDTLKKVTSTGLLDTLLDCDSLNLGVNDFTIVFYAVGDTTRRTASEMLNNTASGSKKALGEIQIAYGVDLQDSIMFIHEYLGHKDTVIKTAAMGIDTSIAASSLGLGVHNFVTRFLYSGETVWLSASDMFHNSRSILPENIAADYCRVYGIVYGVGGSPVKGVEIRANLQRHPTHAVTDTCQNIMIMDFASRKTVTDANGLFSLPLLKSKCLNSGGLYTFELKNNRTGVTNQVPVIVPDSANYQLNLVAH